MSPWRVDLRGAGRPSLVTPSSALDGMIIALDHLGRPPDLVTSTSRWASRRRQLRKAAVVGGDDRAARAVSLHVGRGLARSVLKRGAIVGRLDSLLMSVAVLGLQRLPPACARRGPGPAIRRQLGAPLDRNRTPSPPSRTCSALTLPAFSRASCDRALIAPKSRIGRARNRARPHRPIASFWSAADAADRRSACAPSTPPTRRRGRRRWRCRPR